MEVLQNALNQLPLTSWKQLSESVQNSINEVTENKQLISLSVGAATIATVLWVRYRSQSNEFPNLPNAHWIKGHTEEYRTSNSNGRMLQKLNRTTNYSKAYLRSFVWGSHRLILFTLKDLKELFYTHGQQTIDRNILSMLHPGSTSKDAILDISGPVWKNNRRIFHNHMRTFGRESQLSLILDESKHLTETLEKIPRDYEPNKLLQSAVCNVISTLIFGTRIEYFDPEADKIFDSILTVNGKVLLLPPPMVKVIAFFGLSKVLNARIKSIRDTKTYIQKQIEDRIQAGIRSPAETLIDAYAAELGKGGWKCDIENLIAVIFELFFAGTETTSTTLNWALACLSSHQEVQERVFAEIQAKVGDAKLTLQHLRDLPYTTAVQHEIQRFASIANCTIPHRVSEDMTMSTGEKLKKGEILWACLYNIMRDPAHFKHPDEFNPDNFLNDKEELQSNEAFVPYGVGPRTCLGQTLADLEVKVFMIELVRRFKVSSNDQVDINQSVQGITCSPKSYRYNFELR